MALTISLTISHEVPFKSKAKHKLYEISFLFFVECYNYTILNESDRAQGNQSRNVQKCDRFLSRGWYRFQDEAGTKMADNCVPRYSCGTHAPGYLIGGHPSVAQGIVNRTVCFHWVGGCCQWQQRILVRNCSGFYVYRLSPTRFCNLRYCGDSNSGKSI